MDHVSRGRIGEKPFTEFTHRPIFDFVINSWVNRILNHARNFILVIRHCRILTKYPQGHFRKDKFRSDALGSSLCTNAREMVARFFLVGFAHEEADIGEFVGLAVKLCTEEHEVTCLTTKDTKSTKEEERGKIHFCMFHKIAVPLLSAAARVCPSVKKANVST